MKPMIPPTSRIRFSTARVDITPPVGIYHRMWGAARHDQATGIHRPLLGDVLVFQSMKSEEASPPMIRIQLDHVGFVAEQHEHLKATISDASGISKNQIILTYSHTHAGGWYVPNRFELPGGDLILPYLDELGKKLTEACQEAIPRLQDMTITYGVGWCDMAANRDCWDSEFNGYVTGYNPDSSIDNPVIVGRVTDKNQALNHIFVHYACHPTTLAWENTLLSPDFVGAMREKVELETGATCTYLQGPCGDIGPRDGQQGRTAVADRNGKQLAFSALSTLTSMGPPGHDFQYQGPVISGATLGAWAYKPGTKERLAENEMYTGGVHAVDLPLKPKPDREALEQELADWEARQKEADDQEDTIAARDYGARAERARRWLGRLNDLPSENSYLMHFTVYRMGNVIWVTCGGEPYNLLQTELSRRFPQWLIIVSPLDCGIQVAYLLPEDCYGKGLYQEEPSLLAPGCLERLLEAIAAQIEEVVK